MITKSTAISLLVLAAVLCAAALWFSFKKKPYSYLNILLTAGLIYFISLVIGSLTPRLRGGRLDYATFITAARDFTWMFSRVLTIPIALLCIFVCASNVVLLSKEGFRRNNLLGFIFGGAYLVAATVLWGPLGVFPRVLDAPMLFVRLLMVYGECTILAICIMGFAVLRVKPAYDRDFVIILGCSISKKGKLRPLLKGRVNRAIHFAWEQEIKTGKPVHYVPSGGKGNDEPMSEGSAMEMYLISHGAEGYEVFPEKAAKNTRENIILSKGIIEKQKTDAKVAVVTTNYHCLRGGMLAVDAGMDAFAVGSSTKWYFWPNAFLREIAAILLMHSHVHLAAGVIFLVIAFSLMT